MCRHAEQNRSEVIENRCSDEKRSERRFFYAQTHAEEDS